MRIAVLGWGSLIWDPRDLHLAGIWEKGGPILPIEFSRISRDGRLTLVIDEKIGTDVPSRYAVSSLMELDQAIADLQKREETPDRNRIGFVDLTNDHQCVRSLSLHPHACERIQAWVAQKNFDAAVWTALESNFDIRAKEQFSVDAALRYLNGLRNPIKEKALEYIRNAPEEVATPVRRALALPRGKPALHLWHHRACSRMT